MLPQDGSAHQIRLSLLELLRLIGLDLLVVKHHMVQAMEFLSLPWGSKIHNTAGAQQ